MGRPRKPNGKTEKLSFRIEGWLRRDLEALAAADRRSVSAYIAYVLEQHALTATLREKPPDKKRREPGGHGPSHRFPLSA